MAFYFPIRIWYVFSCLVIIFDEPPRCREVQLKHESKHLIMEAYRDRASSQAGTREEPRPQTRSPVACQGQSWEFKNDIFIHTRKTKQNLRIHTHSIIHSNPREKHRIPSTDPHSWVNNYDCEKVTVSIADPWHNATHCNIPQGTAVYINSLSTFWHPEM